MSFNSSSAGGLDGSKDLKAQYYKRLAFFGLIAIQVTIGIVYKLSQVGGKYTYNPASALVVAEFFKMAISVAMMLKAARGSPSSSNLPIRGLFDFYSSSIPIVYSKGSGYREYDGDGEQTAIAREHL